MGLELNEADVLENESYPQVSEAVRRCSAEILRAWREQVTRVLPMADELTLEQFNDGVPQLLNDLAEALASDHSNSVKRLVADGPEHGATRYHQKFSLNELMIEFSLLRRVVVDVVTSHLNRPLEPRESTALHTGIDVAQRQSTVCYSKYQAEQLATEANTMAKYLSFLSHDLRGGLNGSILMIEVLRRDLQSEERFAESISDLDLMRRSMLETVSTMDRFLHAERLRRGKMPVRIGRIDVATLLNKLVRGFSYQVADRNTTISVSIDVEGPLSTDGDVLNIILQNLLSNAIKYSAGKPIRVEVRRLMGSDDHESSPVRISIIDQGPGMDDAQIKRLYEPFHRGETHGQKGVGLGLTIARQAADLLGAKLNIESQIGIGTTFHVDVPPATNATGATGA